jgi:septal ring factor EnvC (AmiA/AmiB activator)
VSAPVDATVRFAGALPDFGVVAILEPRAGELLILSGLGQAYVRRNQIVSKGEPIGLMPGGQDPEQEKLIESSVVSGQPGQETLYIETRQGRDAIDPATRFDLEAE